MKKILTIASLFCLPLFSQTTAPSRRPMDADQVKQEVSMILERYSPTVREVLGLDPGLLSNATYMAAYPELGSYVQAHPQVAHDPAYYIGAPYRDRDRDRMSPAMRVGEEFLAGSAVLVGGAMLIGLLAWLARTTLDYRRWNRLTRTQTEFHARLLEKMSGHEELLEYVRSPAGARFLEGAPLPSDGPRSVGAPYGRILWSVQAGLVLAAGGSGVIATQSQLPAEVSNFVHAAALLVVSLGVGFILSAGAAYIISRKLGLIVSAQE